MHRTALLLVGVAMATDSRVDLVAAEAPGEIGAYCTSLTFQAPGPHEIAVIVRTGNADEPSLTLTTVQNVQSADHSTGPWVTPLMVLGGIAMAAGMVLRHLVF